MFWESSKLIDCTIVEIDMSMSAESWPATFLFSSMVSFVHKTVFTETSPTWIFRAMEIFLLKLSSKYPLATLLDSQPLSCCKSNMSPPALTRKVAEDLLIQRPVYIDGFSSLRYVAIFSGILEKKWIPQGCRVHFPFLYDMNDLLCGDELDVMLYIF